MNLTIAMKHILPTSKVIVISACHKLIDDRINKNK